jgi:hypothetical protein
MQHPNKHTCNIRLEKYMKHWEHKLTTCIYNHCNICSILIYFCNIRMKHLQHISEALKTLEIYVCNMRFFLSWCLWSIVGDVVPAADDLHLVTQCTPWPRRASVEWGAVGDARSGELASAAWRGMASAARRSGAMRRRMGACTERWPRR